MIVSGGAREMMLVVESLLMTERLLVLVWWWGRRGTGVRGRKRKQICRVTSVRLLSQHKTKKATQLRCGCCCSGGGGSKEGGIGGAEVGRATCLGLNDESICKRESATVVKAADEEEGLERVCTEAPPPPPTPPPPGRSIDEFIEFI